MQLQRVSVVNAVLAASANARYGDAYWSGQQGRHGQRGQLKNQNLSSKVSDDIEKKNTVEEFSDESQNNSSTTLEQIFEVLNFNITLLPEEWKSIYNQNPKNVKRSDSKNSSQYKQLNETPDGLIILNSACTANHMFQKLFEKYPSYTEVKECSTCSYYQKKLFITITANLPTESIDFMQDVLKSTFEENRKCIQCASSIKPRYTSGSHLLIEPVTSKVQYGQNKTQFDLPVVLNDIPTKINMFDNQFTLRGLINFIQPPKCMSNKD
ncbi:hypothetical protein ACI65C_001891 [Semiaphis heraclei]